MRAAVLGLVMLLALAAPARAQDPVRRDSVPAKPNVREQVLRKLRALEAASRPGGPALKGEGPVVGDTTTARDSTAVEDSTAAGAVTPPGAAPVRRDTPPPARDSTRAPASADTGAAGIRSPSGVGIRAPRGIPGPASGVIPAADSVTALLRALEGYVVTEYQAADRAHYAAESGHLELVGSPTLSREGQSMKADSLLRYEQTTSVICGFGKPVLEGQGAEPVVSEQVCYDVDRRLGVALGARTKVTEDATWYVHGDELYTSGTRELYGSHTDFTSCDIEEPHYHFSARRMKVVHNQILVARDVTLRFGDVPVLWLPFMAQSLKRDRRSGLLRPTIGLQHAFRTSSGYRRRIDNIGFYWAINPYLGSQVALSWHSGDYTAVTGSLDFNWERQFLEGGIHFSRYWQATGERSIAIRGDGSWQPGERTSVRASANYASSSSLVRDYSFDPRELNRSIDSNVGVVHRFGWGGSLNLSGSRRQHLDDGRVELTLPSASLSLPTITLFPATGTPRWYNSATWTGSTSFNSRRTTYADSLLVGDVRNRATLDGQASSRFSVGSFSWSQDVTFDQGVSGPSRLGVDSTFIGDSLVVDSLHANARQVGQTIGWRTGISYSQRLFGTTSLTPSVQMSGRVLMPDTLGGERIPEPTRLNFGASLQTNLFGFWPGVGPFSRIRHKVDPRLSYSYSPVPTVTERQRDVFGDQWDGLRETNTLSLTINQTFEAKYAESDTASAEELLEDSIAAARDGEPRRLPQARKITLLSLNTSALVYDFARAREGDYGLTTTQLRHSVGSDFLKGLTLSLSHDLFRITPGDNAAGTRTVRTFAPRIRNVSANFSLSSDSWLFRTLGLAGAATGDGEERAAEADTAAAAEDLEDALAPGASVLPGSDGRDSSTGSRSGRSVGSWRADFKYSLARPAAGDTISTGNQQVQATISFQPTEKWSVHWSTGYSFTRGEFSDHILRLTRDLHDWEASFDFLKAQNGNFVFRFGVHLRADPNIKLDYDQRGNSLDPSRQ